MATYGSIVYELRMPILPLADLYQSAPLTRAVNAPSVPFASIYQNVSLARSQASCPAALPTGSAVINDTTAASMTVNNDTLGASIMANNAIVDLGTLYSTLTLVPSGSPNPTIQDSPAVTLSEVLDFLRSSYDVITPAPTATEEEPTTVVDSSLPKITIETARRSATDATTTPDGCVQ
ncbi:hypothetical protein F4824DRAFT_16003 [Ustulina deusta]|nr:hypothetical protein F4824DRAFT_16003 [Ustulina deusta]